MGLSAVSSSVMFNPTLGDDPIEPGHFSDGLKPPMMKPETGLADNVEPGAILVGNMNRG